MNRLKEIRIKYNLTTRELSFLLGVNRSSLSKIENGTQQLTDYYIKLICDFFEISSDYLLGRSDITNLPDNKNIENKDIYTFTQDNNDMFPTILKNDIITAQYKIALKINDLVVFDSQVYRLICLNPIILKKDNTSTNGIIKLNTLQKVSKLIKITRHFN